MIVDINIKDYYKAFIDNADSDFKEYSRQFITTNKVKNKCLSYIKNNIKLYKDVLSINIDDYEDVIYKGIYDADEKLLKIAINKAKNIVGEGKIAALQLIRYIKLIKAADDYKELMDSVNKRKAIKFGEYKEYLRKYYMQGVHKALINGYVYRFSHNVGEIAINYWKYIDKPKDNYVDFNATNKKKKQLIAAGLKPYDKKEAEIYKIRGIKYDGIPYVVYKTNKEFINIELISCGKRSFGTVKFKHANYIPYKFRGKSVEEIAEMFDNVDELAVQDLGIRHKLVCCLSKDPTLYIKYIRSATQSKYKHNSTNFKFKQKFE